jgi:aminoglycoside 2'-N-acetyltransferase I
MGGTPAIRRLASPELTTAEVHTLRALFAAAWPDSDDAFADEDWEHALGGIHVLLEEDGHILSHASVVPRLLEVSGIPIRTGYVEAVATWPEFQRLGHGSAVIREIDEVIAANYELGALGTGEFAFYERLGWERWRGSTWVRTPTGAARTPAEDGYIMVLRTPATPLDLDLDAPISCEWRAGDVW